MNPTRGSKPPSEKIIQKSQRIYALLLEQFGLPQWRDPLPPIDELVSTILSQNTNDRNRDMAFDRLVTKYANWEAVRDADENEIVEAIRSAGLANQKGPRIQNILRGITQLRGSLEIDFLREKTSEEAHTWLVGFKGIGPKTAAIVMQFSLGIPAFPVDTHVYRVTGRTGLRPEKMSVEKTHAWMEKIYRPDQYGPAHLNFIRHGRKICHARTPVCEECPINKLCDYFSIQIVNKESAI